MVKVAGCMSADEQKSSWRWQYKSIQEKAANIVRRTCKTFKEHTEHLVLLSCMAVIIFSKLLVVNHVITMCEEELVVFTGYVNGVDPVLLALGRQWDSMHFVNIASNGYPIGVSNHILYAFAPLYPSMITLLGGVIGDYYISGIIVSNTFYFMSLVVFYHVARLYMNRVCAYIATTLFAIFPTYLVYGTVAYTEPVALFFAISSWYFFYRERYLPASVLLTLAILTRYVFMLIVPIYGLFMLTRDIDGTEKRNIEWLNIDWRVLYLLIPTVSLFVLFKYFESLTGDFFIIFNSHVFFGDSLKTPIDQFDWFFTGFFTRINNLDPVQTMLERYVFTLPFSVLVLSLFRKSKDLWVYGGVMMWITMSTVGISGIASPRIMLSAWVAFLRFDERIPYYLYILFIPLFIVTGLWVMTRFLTGFFA